jgi:CDP-diacylglycerol--inositol 3-phosphatidyltransferase
MARTATQQTSANHTNGTPNGMPLNGHPKSPTRAIVEAKEDEQTDENIFIFVPNLIGT